MSGIVVKYFSDCCRYDEEIPWQKSFYLYLQVRYAGKPKLHIQTKAAFFPVKLF